MATADQAVADGIGRYPRIILSRDSDSGRPLTAPGLPVWTGVFSRIAAPVRKLKPPLVSCSRLPPAPWRWLRSSTPSRVRHMDPFVGPDEAALEALLAQFEPAASRYAPR